MPDEKRAGRTNDCEIAMKITKLDAIPLKIPFTIGPLVPKSGGQPWLAQEITLVRVETADGLVGWGEAFSYSCQRAVVAAVEDMKPYQ